MKNLAVLVFVVEISLLACSNQEKEAPQISLNDSTCIKFIVDKIHDTLYVQTLFCSFFPFRPCNGKQIEIVNPGVYFMTYRMTKPQMVKFKIVESFQTLLIPGDTLVINVGFETTGNKEPKIYHKVTNNFYDYYQAKKKKFGYYSFTDLDDIPVSKFFNTIEISKQAYTEATKLLATSVEQNNYFLDRDFNNLPKWFIDLEKANITYGSAIVAFYLFNKLTPEDQKNTSMYKVEFNIPKAHLSSLYYYYLYNYLDYKNPIEKNNLSSTKWKTIQFIKGSNLVDSLLSGEINDHYKTCRLADLYYYSTSAEDIEIADTFILNNYRHLSEDKIRFLNYEKNQRIKFLGIKSNLPKGDRAPRFYLKDANGTPFELSNFKGKFVYIHFWATWCAPCIGEIPTLNLLYSKLGNKPIEIINICLDDNPDKWKQIIKRENLKGTNLICKGNWEKSLKRLYFITEIPHYTLVDQNGLIINNKCDGPSEILLEIIQELEKITN